MVVYSFTGVMRVASILDISTAGVLVAASIGFGNGSRCSHGHGSQKERHHCPAD
jgi:hypothetical protein